MLRETRVHPERILLWVFVGLAFIQCERGILYEEVQEVKRAEWAVEEPQVFEWEITDSTKIYDIFITLQHNGDYPYRNLFLFAETESPAELSHRDTLAAFLADPSGKWTGKGSGALISHRFPLMLNKRFSGNGELRIIVHHGMRDPELEGIERLGILIKEHIEDNE